MKTLNLRLALATLASQMTMTFLWGLQDHWKLRVSSSLGVILSWLHGSWPKDLAPLIYDLSKTGKYKSGKLWKIILGCHKSIHNGAHPSIYYPRFSRCSSMSDFSLVPQISSPGSSRRMRATWRLRLLGFSRRQGNEALTISSVMVPNKLRTHGLVHSTK